MAYEQKDGQGSLFRNDRKEKETHPDYNGSITIGGVEYWLSGRLKEGKSGKKYFSLSAKPKQERGERTTRDEKPAQKAEEFSDEIPF